jgi:predicted DNA-binding transcriptional regulator AlpA
MPLVPEDRYDRSAVFRRFFNLLTEEELAEMIGVEARTLQTWRSNGEGPKFCKLGRSVFYRTSDLEEWISSSACGTS